MVEEKICGLTAQEIYFLIFMQLNLINEHPCLKSSLKISKHGRKYISYLNPRLKNGSHTIYQIKEFNEYLNVLNDYCKQYIVSAFDSTVGEQLKELDIMLEIDKNEISVEKFLGHYKFDWFYSVF